MQPLINNALASEPHIEILPSNRCLQCCIAVLSSWVYLNRGFNFRLYLSKVFYSITTYIDVLYKAVNVNTTFNAGNSLVNL